jgi:hypothetical protein
VGPRLKPRLVPVAKNRPVRFRSFDESDEYEESELPLRTTEIEREEKKVGHAPGQLMKGSWMKGVSEDMFRPRQVWSDNNDAVLTLFITGSDRGP